MTDKGSNSTTDTGWPGAVGALGGCLAVATPVLLCLCLGAYAASTLFTVDEGQARPLFPAAPLAFLVLALLTVGAAASAGLALGIRAFADRALSTSEALRITFVSTLLPLRYVVGGLQVLAMLALCPLLLIVPSYAPWALAGLIVTSVFQGLLLLAVRLVGGRGVVTAIVESEE